MSEIIGGGLNKLQDSLQQGKQKLKNAQEISQYKKIILENSERRADYILKLGEEAYRKLRSGEVQDHGLHDIVNDIAALDQVVFKAQKTLDALNQQEVQQACQNCNNPIGPNDKFCVSCGHKVETASTTEEETMTCPTCEEHVPANALFCICCGYRLVN